MGLYYSDPSATLRMFSFEWNFMLYHRKPEDPSSEKNEKGSSGKVPLNSRCLSSEELCLFLLNYKFYDTLS